MLKLTNTLTRTTDVFAPADGATASVAVVAGASGGGIIGEPASGVAP